MSSCLMFRGDCIPKEINISINFLRYTTKKMQFVDWCPTGFKSGINYNPPVLFPKSNLAKTLRSVIMVSNSTSIKEPFSKFNFEFDLMYSKKAYFESFLRDGFDEDCFKEARENIAALILDYEEVENNLPEEEEN